MHFPSPLTLFRKLPYCPAISSVKGGLEYDSRATLVTPQIREAAGSEKINLKLALLLMSVVLLGPADSVAATPMFLDQETQASGIEDIEQIAAYSTKAAEHEYTEKLPNGKPANFLIRVPEDAEKKARKVRGIVFVAPAPDDKFATAKSTLTKAFVGKLGCAVVALSMSAPKDEYWVRGKFYVYPEAGYFEKIAEVIHKVKNDYGEENTPVLLLGKSAGGAMALYLAQDKKIKSSGVVVFNLSQDSDVTPGLLDVDVPTLILSAEDNQWNARIARRHADAIESKRPIAFCIGRPIISLNDEKPYKVNSSGRYGNELAYCFIRDVLTSSEAGVWPGDWKLKSVPINVLNEHWTQCIYSSSEDYNKLYGLASHFLLEVLPGGEQAYICTPTTQKRMIILIKKGSWNRLDQARFASLITRRGCGAIICSAPDSMAAATYLNYNLSRLKSIQADATVIIMSSQTDAQWESAVSEASAGAPFFIVRRASEEISKNDAENPRVVYLKALENYKKKDYENVLFSAPPTWMAPKELDQMLSTYVLDAGGREKPLNR